MRLYKSLLISLLFLLAAWSTSLAQGTAAELRLDVQEFRLRNGMQFLILERHTTPQVACRLAVRAGAALEETGKTGIAHMLEHMMFKGTANFGTLDPLKDRELQDQIEAAYQTVLAEQQKRNPDQEVIKARLAEMDRLRMEVQKIYLPQALSSQFGRNGAVGVNAFTTKDQTQYVMSVPSDMIEQWFSIMSEQIFEPSWREFYVEREVVQREWAFRYVNNPDGAAWLDLSATAYRAHPYRNPTIGWKSDMEKYSTTDAVRFHKKHYNPSNAVCVLVGNVTVEKARKLAEIYFERYPKGERAPERVTEEPPQLGPRKSIRFLKGARTPIVMLGFHTAPMGTKDFYALDAMTMVLSHGRGARMRQQIVEKGLAVDAWAYNPDNRYAGMVVLGGSPKETDDAKGGVSPPEAQRLATLEACEGLERLFLGELEKIRTELIPERELERVKKLNHRDFLDRMRTNEALADTLATLEVEVGWHYLMTYLEKIKEIRPEDVRRAANKYMKTDNMTSVYVIPGGELEQPVEPYSETRSLGGSAAATVRRSDTLINRSTHPTPEGWKHPLSFERRPERIDYPKAETENIEGANIFYLPDRDLPLIDLTLLVKAGAVDVSSSKLGLTKLLSGCLIRGGTEKYSPSELAQTLDENAIRLSVSINEEDSVIRLSVMKEDWQKGLALLEELLARPRLDPRIFDVVKAQSLIALKRQAGDAHAVSMREGMIWHFKGHPYGRDPLDGLKTIPELSRDDLIAFLKTYFVPSNMVVCVAGDIEKTKVMGSLGDLFRALPKSHPPERRLQDPALTPPVLAFIHKPGQVQSQVFLCLPSMRRTHPDFWKMGLLMDIFGGHDSKMYTRLRDDLGLVYAAGFLQNYKWHAGILTGYIGCKGDQTGEAVQETVKIMTELRKDVPEKDLEQKRLDALNSFVFNLDTPAALVEAYGRYDMRREPMDTLARIQDAYMSATREELRLLANAHLDPARLQVFVVGDKTTRVERADGTGVPLDQALQTTAGQLGLPYMELPLR